MTYEQWHSQILKPLLAPKPSIPDDRLDARVVVFAADTDRTQAYVFESDKLPEIRGASRLLAALNRGDEWITQDDALRYWGTPAIQRIFERYDVPSDCLLYAEGGSALAVLPDVCIGEHPLAQYVAADLQQAYLRATLGVATVTTVWRAFTLQELLNGITGPPQSRLPNSTYQARIDAYQSTPAEHNRFGETILLMASRLRRAKQYRAQALVERMPFVQVCHSCRVRPAETVAYTEDRNPWPLCAACETKREWGGVRERSYWFERLTAAGLQVEPAAYPQDLEQINNGQEIALVYADGDSIGARLHQLSTPAEYKAFSQALGKIIEQAVIQAIMGAGLHPYTPEGELEGETEPVHPWEVLTIGGDDIMVIVPAVCAMKFALALTDSFKELAGKNKALAAHGLTMSVGLAIGKVKTPVRLLREAAVSALKSAKHRAKELGEPCIDYHNFVTEGLPGQNLPQWRCATSLVEDRMLTARPYSRNDFVRLLECLSLLASVKFPRAQLHTLADSLRRSSAQGHILYYYQRARLSDELRTQLHNIEQEWGADPEVWPWRASPVSSQHLYSYDTVFIDIASAYDFYKPDLDSREPASHRQ